MPRRVSWRSGSRRTSRSTASNPFSALPGGQHAGAAGLVPERAGRLVPPALLALSAWFAIRSSGFLEMDELTHFMKSRESWSDWRNLIDIWGRPLCTGYYAVAAPWGIRAARAAAVAVAALVGAGTAALGRETGLVTGRTGAGAWVWLLLYAQPMFLLHTFAVMTEMLLACLWVWTAVALVRGGRAVASGLAGLSALVRPEAWLLVAVWAAVLACPEERRRRRPGMAACMLLVVAPSLAWWLAGWAAHGTPLWPAGAWPWPLRSRYGSTPLQFGSSLLLALAVWMVAPVAAGVMRMWKARAAAGGGLRLAVVAAPALGLVAVHGVLGVGGLLGSLSLPRYFVPAAPFFALLAWAGLQPKAGAPAWCPGGAEARTPGGAMMRIPGGALAAAALFPCVLLLAAGQLPLPRNPQLDRLDRAVEVIGAMRGPGAEPASVVAAHPYVYHRLGVPLSSPGHRLAHRRDALAQAAAGTIVVVENILWQYDGHPGPDLLQAWGYERVWQSAQGEMQARPGFPLLRRLMSEHLLALVGDAAVVQVWVRRGPRGEGSGGAAQASWER